MSDDECNCTFDPYEDGTNDESYHFKRTCENCGHVWWGLHCPHDGSQWPCTECGWMKSGTKTPTELLFKSREL